ncbi:glycosyltransferase family 4 protein [Rosettibacter firmus]|uniref:glycosyltransferase family 4 protein n=1 Tax=Rosettibacter firmus TaxID=3111522 RepID=UPI00336BF269
MNVLHIHEFDIGGGAETVFNITRKNIFIENNYSGFISKNNLNKSDIDFKSYEKYNFMLKPFLYVFSINNFIKLNKFLRNNNIDIIHIHGFIGSLSSSILLAIRLHKKRKKIKIVQTLHDFHISCPNSLLFNFKKEVICEKCLGKKIKLKMLTTSCERRGYFYTLLKAIRSFVANNILNHKKIIDKFIAPSNLMKQKLIEDNIDEEKIFLLRNPIKLNEIKYEKKSDIITYYGRISKEKNIYFILDAFNEWKIKSNNNFKLFIIGDGDEKVNIQKYANNLKSNKDIIFYDFKGEKELFDILKDVKYLFMASKLYENAPMTLLEAISLNILPIVPDLGGMKETVKDVFQFGKIYEKNNIESFIKKIEELESEYSLELDKLIKRKAFLLENFGIEAYYKNLFNLYNELSN